MIKMHILLKKGQGGIVRILMWVESIVFVQKNWRCGWGKNQTNDATFIVLLIAKQYKQEKRCWDSKKRQFMTEFYFLENIL